MTESIEAKIEKLLRVADGTANEHESASALSMAQKLADAYNLDLGVIGKSGARKDEQISKGLYQYQRTLYNEIAELNHCKCWVSKGTYKGSKYQTRLLGSKVNVALTKTLCDYVEEATNRLVRERYGNDSRDYFSKPAHLYREGVIDRMVERIKTRRREEEAEREREKREQQARSSHPGAVTENAIVLISDVSREEEKANYDYLNGEGAWDRKEARIAQREEDRRQALAAAEQWERDNPVEAAKRKAEQEEANRAYWADWQKRQDKAQRAADRRRQERIDRFGYDPEDYKSSKPSKYDSADYAAGQRDGNDVGIDDQIDHEKRRGIR